MIARYYSSLGVYYVIYEGTEPQNKGLHHVELSDAGNIKIIFHIDYPYLPSAEDLELFYTLGFNNINNMYVPVSFNGVLCS